MAFFPLNDLILVSSFRFIAGLKNISNEEELKVTTDMINDNFSNYSAWHNRRYSCILFESEYSLKSLLL